MKRLTKTIITPLLISLCLCGCGKETEVYNTLVSTDTVFIEKSQTFINVKDKAGDKEYTFIRTRVLRKKTDTPKSESLIDTDTICIEHLKDVILVIDKTTGEHYLV